LFVEERTGGGLQVDTVGDFRDKKGPIFLWDLWGNEFADILLAV
jgi:hypothetical protein